MTPQEALAMTLDQTRILSAQHMQPDPWQRELLFSTERNILLNCCRGAGKSRTTSALALHTAIFKPPTLVLLISRSQRQAGELFRYVKQGYSAIGRPVSATKETETQLELANGSRIVCLPGKEETIRSFQGVGLLVLDEAARIPDDLFASVSPMTGVAKGRTVALSTPFGQRGWWWKEWHNDKAKWQRFRVPWRHCPRLSKDFIDEELRRFGENWVAQEYECSFTSMEGLVYPDFNERTRANIMAPPGKRVGGIMAKQPAGHTHQFSEKLVRRCPFAQFSAMNGVRRL
jgi:Terminase large subunit, T4likevirus-type, N-terminal